MNYKIDNEIKEEATRAIENMIKVFEKMNITSEEAFILLQDYNVRLYVKKDGNIQIISIRKGNTDMQYYY